ncbi:MAG TPA: hypothetical protein VJG32_00635 [Anaerolineae bacterium]|nr:hypothetical protein [Anaerolineae bacterium]
MLELSVLVAVTLICLFAVPLARMVVGAGFHAVPVDSSALLSQDIEPVSFHIWVAVLTGLASLVVYILKRGRTALLYGFLAPSLALSVWFLNRQDLSVIIPIGWPTLALLAGLVGLLLGIFAQHLILQPRSRREWFAIVGTTVLCFFSIRIVRSIIRPGLNDVPLPFTEPLTIHLQVAASVGLVGLIIRLFVKGPRAILYGFLLPFVAMLVWAFDKQSLLINPDIWKLFERGWFTSAVLAGLAGLFWAISVPYLFFKLFSNPRRQGVEQ